MQLSNGAATSEQFMIMQELEDEEESADANEEE